MSHETIEVQREKAHTIVHNWAAEMGYSELTIDLQNLIEDITEALVKTVDKAQNAGAQDAPEKGVSYV